MLETWDILVIDSGSTDGTFEFLNDQPRTTVHSIPSNEFGHGKDPKSRSTMATGDLVLMTVQDARPRNSSWISNMVQALESNGLDGVCGKQAVPSEEDKNPMQWYRPISEPNEDEFFDAASVQDASPEETMKACSWDNVNALYRKSSLLARIRFAMSDLARTCSGPWIRLQANGKIGYTHQSKVWHYHHQRPGFTRKAGFLHPLLALPSLWMLALKLRRMWGISRYHTSPQNHDVACAHLSIRLCSSNGCRYNQQIAKESTEITEEFLKRSSKR